MKNRDGLIVAAALAGLVAASAPALAKNDKKKTKDAKDEVKCYGVNKCAGHNKCAGAGNACAGKNACKGKGWLPMPKESCDNIEGGTTREPAAEKSDAKKDPMKDMGSK
ncbi:MAG: hypothetical protein HY923_03555 [Elusimicrobia bacterium]|nr:hypothetical protein [Elusimicrobiota bacterium]